MLCPFFITSVNIKTQVPFFSYSILNNTKHVQRNVILSSSPVKWWKRSFLRFHIHQGGGDGKPLYLEPKILTSPHIPIRPCSFLYIFFQYVLWVIHFPLRAILHRFHESPSNPSKSYICICMFSMYLLIHTTDVPHYFLVKEVLLCIDFQSVLAQCPRDMEITI